MQVPVTLRGKAELVNVKLYAHTSVGTSGHTKGRIIQKKLLLFVAREA